MSKYVEDVYFAGDNDGGCHVVYTLAAGARRSANSLVEALKEVLAKAKGEFKDVCEMHFDKIEYYAAAYRRFLWELICESNIKAKSDTTLTKLAFPTNITVEKHEGDMRTVAAVTVSKWSVMVNYTYMSYEEGAPGLSDAELNQEFDVGVDSLDV